jgi:hypothetical protein
MVPIAFGRILDQGTRLELEHLRALGVAPALRVVEISFALPLSSQSLPLSPSSRSLAWSLTESFAFTLGELKTTREIPGIFPDVSAKPKTWVAMCASLSRAGGGQLLWEGEGGEGI